MAFAQGSRSSLSLVVESSYGTTPGTPSMVNIPFSNHSLDEVRTRAQGDDIQADRMPRVDRHGVRNATGDIAVNLRQTDYDELFESLFFDTFATSGADSLKVGTTPQFLTIEDRAEDIGQYRQFVGMAVSQFALSAQPGEIVRGTFTMVGKQMTLAQSSLGSPAAASGNEPFDTFNGSISEGGSEIAIISGIDFTMNNSFAPAFVVGSQVAPQLEYGRAVVEGTLQAYFEDNALIDKFLDETASSLALTLEDGTSGGAYTFTFPNIKYNGASVPVQDPQSRIVSLPFVALYDSATSTNIQLTRAA